MSPHSTNEYRYSPLGPRQIRLVQLYPSQANERICCSIDCVSIDQKPSFEALSYTWGTSADKIVINVGSASLSVGENLAVALRALAPTNNQRTLWIDAICINQNDSIERNHQVRFMKEVYSQASSVLIWLGEAADGSDSIMDYVSSLDATSALKEHRAWVDYSQTWSWDRSTPFQQPPIEIAAFDALLCRPWFSRVWIQQEAALNGKTTVVCGSKSTTWEQLFSLVWSYEKPLGSGFAKDAFQVNTLASSVLILMIQSYQYDDIDILLLDVLRDCTYCGATDPRDRIYGIQSLARDPDLDKLLLEPNYDQSVCVVYTDLAKRFLTSQGPFILTWAGRSNQRHADFPSWTPDWTMKNIELPSVIFQAAGDTRNDCRIESRNGKEILLASGLTVSSISFLGTEPAMAPYHGQLDSPDIFQKLKTNIEACINMVETSSNNVKGKINRQNLWRTLAVDSTRSWTRLRSAYSDDLMTFPDWLCAYQGGATSDIPHSYLEYLEILNLRGVFIFRRFAIDDKGNMCIVPYSTEKGDIVVVVAGLTMPLVVRDNGKEGMEIIGECYVDRHMDGKVVEGIDLQNFRQFTFI